MTAKTEPRYVTNWLRAVPAPLVGLFTGVILAWITAAVMDGGGSELGAIFIVIGALIIFLAAILIWVVLMRLKKTGPLSACLLGLVLPLFFIILYNMRGGDGNIVKNLGADCVFISIGGLAGLVSWRIAYRRNPRYELALQGTE